MNENKKNEFSRDTAGQKNFRTIGKSYYASTKAFILVYDVTNRETFRLIEQFNHFIEQVRSIQTKTSNLFFENSFPRRN